MQFGEKLRTLRKSRHMTQADLAESLNITSRTLINYELGKCLPKKTEIIKRIATLFDVSVDYLMSEDDYPSDNHADGNKHVTEDDIQQFLDQATGLFSGGKLSENDRDFVIRSITELYWETRDQSRRQNRESDSDAPKAD